MKDPINGVFFLGDFAMMPNRSRSKRHILEGQVAGAIAGL